MPGRSSVAILAQAIFAHSTKFDLRAMLKAVEWLEEARRKKDEGRREGKKKEIRKKEEVSRKAKKRRRNKKKKAGKKASGRRKKETKKKSRIIYRAIKSFNKEIGDLLLQHMDADV